VPPPPASAAPRRRALARTIILDRALEALPLFRLSDSSDDSAITYQPDAGGRWRVIPAPGDRLPGTFDQDVYVELLHRFHDAGAPADGVVQFTLHNFLRSMGRKADGRTYEQLRGALVRLERTQLESTSAWLDATTGRPADARFTVLSSVVIDRRRTTEREQLALFPSLAASEPGDARVVIALPVRTNIAAGHTCTLSVAHYLALSSPVARRLYRLLEVVRAEGRDAWSLPLERLAERLPLTQRYPSHLQRVLQPAHEMLVTSGGVHEARFRQERRDWFAEYVLADRAAEG
jgi:plasmid replication initiation protein